MIESKSNFYDDVYEVVRQIPKGRVTSYGAIGAYLGIKRSARMVGWALSQSGVSQDIPAHRVLNRNGLLTAKAHFGGDRMQKLLEAEGLTIEHDQLKGFAEYLWDPKIELGF